MFFSIPTNNMHGSASRSASVSSSLFYSQDHFDTIFIPNPQDHSLSKIPGPALSMAIHLRHRSHRRRRRNRWKHRRVRWRQDGDGRWRGWIWGQQTPRFWTRRDVVTIVICVSLCFKMNHMNHHLSVVSPYFWWLNVHHWWLMMVRSQIKFHSNHSTTIMIDQ